MLCSIRQFNPGSVSSTCVPLFPTDVGAYRSLRLNARHHIKSKGASANGINSIPIHLRDIRVETSVIEQVEFVSKSACENIHDSKDALLRITQRPGQLQSTMSVICIQVSSK